MLQPDTELTQGGSSQPQPVNPDSILVPSIPTRVTWDSFSSAGEPGTNSVVPGTLLTRTTPASVQQGRLLPDTPRDGAVVVNGQVVPVSGSSRGWSYGGYFPPPSLDTPMAAAKLKLLRKAKMKSEREASRVYAK